MTDVQIHSGTLLATVDERSRSWLLVPFGEECSSNLGRFKVDSGVFSIPEDLRGAVFSIDHEREKAAGDFTTMHETPQGIVATSYFARTPLGDDALRQVDSGERRSISAEVADVVIRNGRAVAGRIFGGSLVKRGAFPSATLLAAAADTPDPTGSSSHSEDEYTDENGVTWRRVADTETSTETADDGTITTTSTTTVTEETTPADQPANTQEDNVGAATVPGTLVAGATANDEGVDKSTFLGMLGRAMVTKDSTLLAALNDVKISGANTIGAAAVVPQYVGELWSGRQYQRRYVPLFGHGDLTSTTVIGWKWDVLPEVDTWNGNKSAIPTNTPTAKPYNLGFQRFAGGWDIAREYIDFGQTEVIDELMAKAVLSYAKKSDKYALAQVLAAATVAPVGALPVGADVVTTPTLVKLVRGALRVLTQADALPSFGIVDPAGYEEILLLKENNALKFLSTSLGLEEGTLDSFKVIPSADMAAGNVLVGAKEAATVLELPGSPIRVNALDIANGGVDEAVFGYESVKIDEPLALQLVTNAA